MLFEVLRAASLLENAAWMEMLTARNQLTHDYDGEIIKRYCHKIIETYIDLFYAFEQKVEELFSDNL